ncbi:tyrosine-type recombinase/integrase [Arhodomonas sp. SL1]|uniref:tyrosine-type recombinase/integrase n=1 Tax=Arhodomonas sp. SL1 TaxID=3425691 RepID=UPI003F8837B3
MPSLTDVRIRKMTPPARGRRLVFDEHRDAPKGFGLRVTAVGKVAFVLRYLTSGGKDRLLTVGEYPTWSLAAARKRAAELRREIDSGADILEQRREERAEPTVTDVSEWFLQTKRDRKSYRDIEGAVLGHIVRALGRKRMREVRRRDVIVLIERLAAGHPRQAGRVLVYAKQLFEYAEDREIIEASPIATLKSSKIGPGLTARRRARVLHDDEIRAFWQGVETCGMHRLTALALKLVLVTGQRPGEVAGMRWDELDGRLWTIPAERRGKTDTAHVVPLTDTALALLEAARDEVERLSHRYPRTGEYVFEARPGSALTNLAISRAASRYADALGNRDAETWGHWTPHDLRRTCRTGLAAIGVDEVVAEVTIGHTRKGIAAVYDLHRYDREKRAALAAWERRLLQVVG